MKTTGIPSTSRLTKAELIAENVPLQPVNERLELRMAELTPLPATPHDVNPHINLEEQPEQFEDARDTVPMFTDVLFQEVLCLRSEFKVVNDRLNTTQQWPVTTLQASGFSTTVPIFPDRSQGLDMTFPKSTYQNVSPNYTFGPSIMPRVPDLIVFNGEDDSISPSVFIR